MSNWQERLLLGSNDQFSRLYIIGRGCLFLLNPWIDFAYTQQVYYELRLPPF